MTDPTSEAISDATAEQIDPTDDPEIETEPEPQADGSTLVADEPTHSD